MKTLEAMTKAELLELATKYDVTGRVTMNKAELLAAVTPLHLHEPEQLPADELGATELVPVALDEGGEGFGDAVADPDAPAAAPVAPPEEPAPPTLPEGTPPPEPPAPPEADANADLPPELPPAPEVSDDEPPPDPASAEALALEEREILAVKNAPTEKLRAVLDDPDFPPHLLRAVRDELRERNTAYKAAAKQAALRGKQTEQNYTVAKAARFITKDGFITELAPGCLLTRLTHDLDFVRSQGIELVECKGVEIAYDEMGKQLTRIV